MAPAVSIVFQLRRDTFVITTCMVALAIATILQTNTHIAAHILLFNVDLFPLLPLIVNFSELLERVVLIPDDSTRGITLQRH